MGKKDPFNKTLAGHVHKRMEAHKKVKKATILSHKSGPRTVKVTSMEELMDELEMKEVDREKRDDMHDLLNEGLESLFTEINVSIMRDAHTLDERSRAKLMSQFRAACLDRVETMDLDDLDDLLYFLNLTDGETGAWYWIDVGPDLEGAVERRLRVLQEEEEYEDE